ncbi:MAG: sulfur carrier protein ThiS [Variibacter sp.]|nr:sulfur carrier protein ThiS [Variibacter sp.]
MTDATATILVNGQREPLRPGTLAALLQERGIDPEGRGIAVAVNGAVVPRAAWPHTRLAAGDTVEIVQAKQGG